MPEGRILLARREDTISSIPPPGISIPVPSCEQHYQLRVCTAGASFIHSFSHSLSVEDLEDGSLPGFENGIKLENSTI